MSWPAITEQQRHGRRVDEPRGDCDVCAQSFSRRKVTLLPCTPMLAMRLPTRTKLAACDRRARLRSGGLLDDEIVLNALYSGNDLSVFAGGGLLSRSIHEAAELHDALDRLNADRE